MQFRVNLRNGQTRKLSPSQLEKVNPADITAVAVLNNGAQHVLPLPLNFHRIQYRIEQTDKYSKITCMADDTVVELTVYGNLAKTVIRRRKPIWHGTDSQPR